MDRQSVQSRSSDADPAQSVADPAQTDAEPPLSKSIERIRRLEALERRRLAEKVEREQRRQGLIAGARPSGGRHEQVERLERITRIPLALLGIAWLVIAILVLGAKVSGTVSDSLVAVLFTLWAIALLEYMVRLVVTPDRRGYLRRRWAEPATVVVPCFAGWHLIGIEKVTLVIHEGLLRVEAILKHHSLFRVILAATGTLFLGAWLVMLCEERAKGSNIHNYPDALWWAIVTVTTVGYGDRYPVIGGGRTVAVVLTLVGIGLIGVLTATVASVFVTEHAEANKEEIKQGHVSLALQIAVIGDRLADVERRLGASPWFDVGGRLSS